jgi:hypothetical protein
VHEAGESTPEIVEAHLRADRNLDAKTAAALGRIIRTAYKQFAQPLSFHARSRVHEDAIQVEQQRGTL